MLDAEYNFGLVSYVTRRLIKNCDIPKVVLVGISYDVSYDRYYKNRGRDLTPTRSKQFLPSGKANQFIKFMIEELFPFIQKSYRVNMSEKALVGHSFGGLFGYYIIFRHPGLFQKYLLVSPSLWWDKRFIFREVSNALAKGTTFEGILFTSIGDAESYMVEDLKRMVDLLSSAKSGFMKIDFKIHEGENHRSVFATAFSKGMRTIFGN